MFHLIHILLAPAVYHIVSVLVYSLLQPLAGGREWYETLSAGLSAALALALLLPEYRKDCLQRRVKKDPDVLSGQKRLGQCIIFTIAGIGFSLFSSWMMEHLGIAGRFSNQIQAQLFAAPVWLQVISLVLLVPLGEELVYRGLLYSRLRQYIPVPAAAAVSAVLFAAGHGNMIQFLHALPGAVLMAMAFEYTKSLSAPFCFHMGANLISVILTQTSGI